MGMGNNIQKKRLKKKIIIPLFLKKTKQSINVIKKKKILQICNIFNTKNLKSQKIRNNLKKKVFLKFVKLFKRKKKKKFKFFFLLNLHKFMYILDIGSDKKLKLKKKFNVLLNQEKNE